MKSNAMFQAAFKCQEKNACLCFTPQGDRHRRDPPLKYILYIKLFQKLLYPTLYQLTVETQTIQVSFQHSLDSQIKKSSLWKCCLLSEALQITCAPQLSKKKGFPSLAQTSCRGPALWHLCWVIASQLGILACHGQVPLYQKHPSTIGQNICFLLNINLCLTYQSLFLKC